MKECYCYKSLDSKKVKCFACAHNCIILDGKIGICEVRENIDGKLYSKVYDKIIAMHIDPIEKKPFYHFLPESQAFSIGTIGCNFNCKFCQNHDISFPGEKKIISGEKISPVEIVNLALKNNCECIAYTYTEPTIFLELVHDTCKIAKEKKLKNVLVTNGYLTIESLDLLSKYIDAMNIDLKSFSEDFYKKNCKSKLAPVLNTIREAHKRKIWIEITTLLIEGENTTDDEIRNIAKFISSVDKNIPWHISRFFPMHKMKNVPPTSLDILKKAQIIGKEEGLNYVYIGNTNINSDTFCPKCRKTLISRHAYRTIIEGIDNNSCKYCKTKIDGIFS